MVWQIWGCLGGLTGQHSQGVLRGRREVWKRENPPLSWCLSIGVTCHEIGANTTVAPQQEDDEGGKRGKQAGMDGICFQG